MKKIYLSRSEFQRSKKYFVREADYFSDAQKEKRERDVVSYFLVTIGLSFKKEELISPDQESFIDVNFRDASFQNKESTSQSAAFARFPKEVGKAWRNADSYDEVLKDPNYKKAFQAENIIYELQYEEALKVATDAAKKYKKEEKEKMDLLIHDTNTKNLQITDRDILSDKFRKFGFRSVLHLSEFGRQASILHSSKNSPTFIRHLEKKIFFYPAS